MKDINHEWNVVDTRVLHAWVEQLGFVGIKRSATWLRAWLDDLGTIENAL